MATASEAVDAAYKKYLNRSAGATGKAYWEKTWEADYQKALDNNMTPAQAEAEATAATNKHIGGSTEGKVYAKTGITKTAIEGTAGYDTIDDAADWYTSTSTTDDPNEFAFGMRDADWSTKLNTTNLENYTQGLNKMYGKLQGNTVGQEGLEYWGYTKTQAIDHYMSDAGGNYSFDTASKLADFDIESDIKRNTGHQNYKKFGSIGYGNPLEIKTGVDGDGDLITEERYLNLDPDAISEGLGLGGGSKTATQYELDDDGNIKLDDDGNQIVATDDDGNPITATPYQWNYVADDSAPGGYRIEPAGVDADGNPIAGFDTGAGISTAGHDYLMANYQKDGAFQGGGGANPFTIPTGVQNVDATQFTSGGADKLDLATWAETPAGKLAIEAGNFDIKNKWMADTTGDSYLNYVSSGIDHSTTDSNLGLGTGQTANIDWGGGWQTKLSGEPSSTPYVPPAATESGGAGGGNTIILDTNQESTTAADQLVKREDRGMYSGAGRKGFSTLKYKPTGNISTLGIVS